MNLIVIGCGRVGSELAYRLFKKGHKVTVIDQSDQSFGNLPDDFLGRMIEGEALNNEILLHAGIETADGVAIVTNSDTTNAVIGHTIRKVYQITNVVVRNFNPLWRPLYEAFGLQTISSTSWGAQRIEELLYHRDMRTVFSAGNGEVEVYEFTIPMEWNKHLLKELIQSNECVPVGLTRAGKAIIPTGETVLTVGDIVLVSATFDGIRSLRSRVYEQEAK
jgi:trk system potassium uptake protein TrkA